MLGPPTAADRGTRDDRHGGCSTERHGAAWRMVLGRAVVGRLGVRAPSGHLQGLLECGAEFL